MYVVVMRDAAYFGPRTSFFLARNAISPDEALETAKGEMEDWGLDALEAGRVKTEVLECTAKFVLEDGKLASAPII